MDTRLQANRALRDCQGRCCAGARLVCLPVCGKHVDGVIYFSTASHPAEDQRGLNQVIVSNWHPTSALDLNAHRMRRFC